MTAHADRPTKSQWRTRLLAARRVLPPAERVEQAAALARHAVALCAGVDGPVGAYMPMGTEPGSPALVEALQAAGHEVLLPVVADLAGPLDWAGYDGPSALAAGPLGLQEPTGPRRGPGAVAEVGILLMPALAADLTGVRLGRGEGHYDRTLTMVTPGTPLVVLLYDSELVAELPAEPHDRPVTAALLASSGLRPLGKIR